MELSKRLGAVASLVTPGMRIVDIGTDHAYIPIYLIEKKLVPTAIAMDVNEGPLKRAEAHIREAGMSRVISVRCSDGFGKLEPGEADSAILAGMGGGLMIRILSSNRDAAYSMQEYVLQPQSEIARVRRFLLEHQFLIIQEDMVLDEGKFYPMMKVCPPVGNTESFPETAGRETRSACQQLWNETEIRYGKFLLEGQHPVLREFLLREKRIHTRIYDELKEKSGSLIEKRKQELQEELLQIEKGLKYYAM